tara:strand:- start:60 stop:290 length:231 start_codon:yes stop_codon:yes gene_type:complete
MINLLVITCTILLIALIGTVIAAKKGWLADRDNDGFADVIEDKFDEVEDWVEDKVDDVKEATKKITRKKPGRKSKK